MIFPWLHNPTNEDMGIQHHEDRIEEFKIVCAYLREKKVPEPTTMPMEELIRRVAILEEQQSYFTEGLLRTLKGFWKDANGDGAAGAAAILKALDPRIDVSGVVDFPKE
jgi:hypothetical protein